MKIGFINCPRSLLEIPAKWPHDLALELAVEEEKGNMIGLTDNAMLRVSVEVLVHQAKSTPVDKIILWGGLPEYSFIKQYLEALKPYAKEVTVRGFPEGIVDVPTEKLAASEYGPDELPYPSWYHFPLPDYWQNSALPYTGETATIKQRSFIKSVWGERSQSPKRFMETLRYLRLVYSYDWMDIEDDLSIDRKRTSEIIDLFDDYDLAGLFKWSCRADPDLVDRPIIASLREAGCRVVDLGTFDVFDTRNLAKTCRLETAINVCRSHGLYPLLQCVIGSPYSKKDDVVEALTFLMKMELPYRPKLAEIYPGTKLYDEAHVMKLRSIDEQLLLLNRSFWNLTKWTDIELLGIIELMARGDLKKLREIDETSLDN